MWKTRSGLSLLQMTQRKEEGEAFTAQIFFLICLLLFFFFFFTAGQLGSFLSVKI